MFARRVLARLGSGVLLVASSGEFGARRSGCCVHTGVAASGGGCGGGLVVAQNCGGVRLHAAQSCLVCVNGSRYDRQSRLRFVRNSAADTNEEANSLTGEPLTTDEEELGGVQPDTTTQFVPPPTNHHHHHHYHNNNDHNHTGTHHHQPQRRRRQVEVATVAATARPEPVCGRTDEQHHYERAPNRRTMPPREPAFQPSKNRVEGQVSAYGRRGSKKPVTERREQQCH
ncbi:hypothetical protein LSTR_LSTR012244 [Laodelphax striatellus]|uniref:Secreted protein n=1 Tax=Laodelphax striatellus TaxID=195883 RepID=A0A482X761_LAOST|nr:hypothetical protein LSTR_LSTR012244 [Laodelphax striatellus]